MQEISKLQEREAAPDRAEKSALSVAETLELQSLFELIADTCDAASMALETGSDLKRLKGLTGRIDSMVGLAKSMLD